MTDSQIPLTRLPLPMQLLALGMLTAQESADVLRDRANLSAQQKIALALWRPERAH